MTLDRRPFPRRLLGIQIETKGEALVRLMSVNDVRDDLASLRDVVREPADGAVIGMEIECRGDYRRRGVKLTPSASRTMRSCSRRCAVG